MATHSRVLAWRVPGTGSLGGCRLWGHTESDTTDVTEQRQRQQCSFGYGNKEAPTFKAHSLLLGY